MSDGDRVNISDEELTALALAADPTAPLDPDATPWFGAAVTDLLPEWYMPAPVSRGRGRLSQVAAVSIVVGMVVVCAFGLCVTSGFLQLA